MTDNKEVSEYALALEAFLDCQENDWSVRDMAHEDRQAIKKALRIAEALERGPTWIMEENGKKAVALRSNGQISTNQCRIAFEAMVASMKMGIGDE